MRPILAIETSSELASAALAVDGQVISRAASGVQTHSQALLPMVQELLSEGGVSLSACGAVAFGAGPGSFTGVRTACGVAQGLAFGAGLPVIPVSTLLAMAHACRNASAASDILVLLDARMDEVYWAQYRYQEAWREVTPPALSPAKDVQPIGEVVACGNGLSIYASAFEAKPFARRIAGIAPHATQIAELAQIDLAAGRVLNAREAQPIYLRNKVALTTAERLAKAAA